MDNSKHSPTSNQLNLRSLTRLIVGGMLIGYEDLAIRLNHSESELDHQGDTSLSEENNELVESTVADPRQVKAESPLRYMAIGMVFGFQDLAARGLSITYRMTRTASNLVDVVANPIYQSRILSPLRSSVDKLAERGQQEVNRWIEVGQFEEGRSRALTQMTINDQVDDSIKHLTANEEVQELVQSQSVGLIGEIVEETRERAVSADNFFEAVVRSMFRLSPRTELPAPPPEVQAQATPFRQIRGRIIRK